jgi:probable rRNA maturation factor
MSPGDSTVLFRALPIPLKFPKEDQQVLSDFASTLSEIVAGRRPFTCLITNNRSLRKLNQQFLGHDYATDVLSFPSGDGNSPGDSLGDLAISVEKAEAQAVEFGHSRLDEVRILMLHGLLHLLGFDHETDRGQMARAERKWRLHFDLPSNLIERARPELAS